jgi:RNA polymerase sigma factor (sigma-70 family)
VVEDACQVAWTALICRSERVDPERASGWLVRTAIREALRLMRIADREDSLVRELEVPTDLGPEELAWRRAQVQSLRLLSVRQQRLVWLRALGLSYEEMASYERCTKRTVHRQLERARRRLRVLEDAGETERRAA